MPKLKKMQVDPETRETGAWVDLFEDESGMFRVRVRPSSTPGFVAFLQKQAKRSQAVLNQNKRFEADAHELMRREPVIREAVIRHLLAGWEGLQDEEGNEIPFSTETALELLNNADSQPLVDAIATAAADSANFRKAELVVDEGNSSHSSNGSSDSPHG